LSEIIIAADSVDKPKQGGGKIPPAYTGRDPSSIKRQLSIYQKRKLNSFRYYFDNNNTSTQQ